MYKKQRIFGQKGFGIVHNKLKEHEISEEEKECAKNVVSFDKENPNLKDTVFPFVTTHKQLEKYIIISSWIQPTLNYKEKYNSDKFDSKVYQNTSNQSILDTINYIFNKMKSGIFVRIYNNILANFIPLHNLEYKNDFSKHLKIEEGSIENYMNSKRKHFKHVPKMYKDMSKWATSNCTLRPEEEERWVVQEYMPEMYDMIRETLHNRKVNDCIFFINRKDFPYLDKNYNEAYEEIYGDDKKLEHPYDKYKFIPILGQSTTNKHADIPIPTGDDWDIISQRYFGYKKNKCKNNYILKDIKIPKWEDRKDIVVWRGTGTGCGDTIEDNPRFKVTKMTEQLEKEGEKEGKKERNIFLDAGVVEFVDRDKKIKKDNKVRFFKNNENLKVREFLSPQEQLQYKYILNIEGNSAAYRFGSLFRFGYCVLNVESKYKLWFEQWLEEGVHYIGIKHDLSNLVEKIEWCLKNDDKCKQIAINGMHFFNTYFTKNFVYDYMSDILNKTSSMFTKYSPEPEKQLYDYNVLKKYKQEISQKYRTKEEIIKITEDGDKNNMVIIVCYRDNPMQGRKKQLEKFLDYLKDYNVIVAEQSDDGRKFNRGALLNVGYDYACKENKKYINFVFHDVDLLLPYKIIDKYYCDEKYDIIHLGRMIPDYYKQVQDFMGGIIKFKGECFKDVNGFPNNFYGWGSEDSALRHRVNGKGYKVSIPNEKEEGFEMKHAKTSVIPSLTNSLRYESFIVDELTWQMNGVRDVQYKILDTQLVQKNAIKITIDLC